MFRLLRRMPLFRLLAIAKIVLLAHRQFRSLERGDRRRLGELVRRGPRMTAAERGELRGLLAKLKPRDLAVAAFGAFSPVRLPRRFTGR